MLSHNQNAENGNKTFGPSPCTCSTEPHVRSCLRSVRGAWKTVTYKDILQREVNENMWDWERQRRSDPL